MAIYADITADQGSNFSSEITVTDVDDSPIDLTNYTARGQIRRTYTSSSATSFAAVVSNPTSGIVSISLTSATTTNMKPGRYVYDVEIVSNTNIVTRVIEGQFILTPSVTRID